MSTNTSHPLKNTNGTKTYKVNDIINKKIQTYGMMTTWSVK